MFAYTLVDLMELRLDTRQLILDFQKLGLVVALIKELGFAGRIDDNLKVIYDLLLLPTTGVVLPTIFR